MTSVICEALQHAHDEGILHRDIKPSNILLDTRGRVKIADFGIAKLLGDRTRDVTLTASGAAIGTPQYMAPEQIEHPQDVDTRADIYSLGVVFYEMLTGELPIGRFAPPSEKAAVDSRVDEVVFHALEKEREKRFHSAGEVKTSVEAITASRSNPDAAAQSGVGRPSSLGPAGTLVMSARTRPEGAGAKIHAADPVPGTIGVGSYLPEVVAAPEASPARDFLICNPHLPRVAQAILVYALLIAPFLWALGLTVRYPEVDLSAHTAAAFLEAGRGFLGSLGVLATTVLLMAGALKLRVLSPSSQRMLRAAIWLRLWMIVLGFCTMAWVKMLEVDSGPTPLVGGGTPPTVLNILLAVRMVATGFEVARLIWLRRHRIWLDELCHAAVGAASPTVLPGRDANASVPTSHSSPQAAERRATCYFSTPARMRNCFPGPQAHIFQCKGELQREATELVFVSPWQTRVVIPLNEIRDLSIGQFQMWTTPWVMIYGRFNFISITFGTKGQERTVHLTPVPEGSPSTEQANAAVATWFEAIRNAVADLTGAMPKSTTPSAVTFSAERPWNRKGGPLCLAFLLSDALWIWRSMTPTPPLLMSLVVVVVFLLLMAVLWFCHGFLSADRAIKRDVFDAITSDEPPGDLPASASTHSVKPGESRRPLAWTISAWAFVAIGLLAVVDTLGMLYTRPFSFTLYPGWGHLFAGVALLTLNRRWRIAALIALAIVDVAGAYVGATMILWPDKGGSVVMLPLAGMAISAAGQPYLAAAAAVLLTLVFAWPCYLLLCARGRTLFDLDPKE